MSTEREAFNAWFAKQWPEFPHQTASAFECWQAGAAEERERCARICDSAADAAWAWWDSRANPEDQGAAIQAEELASRIRDGKDS